MAKNIAYTPLPIIYFALVFDTKAMNLYLIENWQNFEDLRPTKVVGLTNTDNANFRYRIRIGGHY